MKKDSIEKYSNDAKVLLSNSELYQVKAGHTPINPGPTICGFCQACVACSICVLCTTVVIS